MIFFLLFIVVIEFILVIQLIEMEWLIFLFPFLFEELIRRWAFSSSLYQITPTDVGISACISL